ncbi:hypothetical protein [Haloferula sp. A504]|uniref:hypothetical protein n=1 Tax=Haloferula sp. A504 TaxID=3373601 RepID=UPI0031C1AD7E|nr:hypothetical protein [Verrucomicrobiaceae bacterium E54]
MNKEVIKLLLGILSILQGPLYSGDAESELSPDKLGEDRVRSASLGNCAVVYSMAGPFWGKTKTKRVLGDAEVEVWQLVHENVGILRIRDDLIVNGMRFADAARSSLVIVHDPQEGLIELNDELMRASPRVAIDSPKGEMNASWEAGEITIRGTLAGEGSENHCKTEGGFRSEFVAGSVSVRIENWRLFIWGVDQGEVKAGKIVIDEADSSVTTSTGKRLIQR